LLFHREQIAVRPPLKSHPKRRMMGMPTRQKWLVWTVAWAVPLFCFGCATPRSERLPESSPAVANTVYVVHHGSLHTGLTIKRSEIPSGHWPASRDYSGSKYIEVGWGDDDGYRKPLTPAIALKALAGSKRTVLLADGFSQSIRRKYTDPKFTVLAVSLSESDLGRLCDHIQQTYALDDHGNPIRLGSGWYRARGTYSAFNTCNTWVAAGLHKAGCPIDPTLCLLPRQLLARVRPFARPVRERFSPRR
jgi:hypothetical protein